MDLPLEYSPSTRTAQSNKLAVFSSIENRSDILEARKLATSDEMSSDYKSQNIQSYNNMETKRYAAPQNLKDSFYAIHHIQKSIKENNERILQQLENTAPTSENVEPTPTEESTSASKPLGAKTTTTVRGRKRIAPEQIHKYTPPSAIAAAASIHHQMSSSPPHTNSQQQQQTESVKRKKSRQQNPKSQRKSTTAATSMSSSTTAAAAELPSLYQTCVGLWPEQHSLGDYSHDNIKSLSNLLKVRLCQAKFKMLGSLDGDNELFSFLAEECASPRPRSPHTIKFSGKQSKSSLSLVGNGKNLFSRHQNNHYRYDASSTQQQASYSTGKDDPYSKQAHTPKDNTHANATTTSTTTTTASPQRTPLNTNKTKERKKKTPRTNAAKTTTKKNTTPKRKSAAADVTPIVQSDGSSVYLCIPCEKKYKNRNGLAYHLERCKYTLKQGGESNGNGSSNNSGKEEAEEQSSSSSQNGDNVIHCVCSQNTDEHGTMVQCDKCRIWLHSECVGLTEENADDVVFHCQTCKESSTHTTTTTATTTATTSTTAIQHGTSPNDLLQSLLDAQQSPSDREDILSQNIHDIFSQTTGNDDLQSDDDFPAIEDDETNSEMNHDIPSSTQLHVWDDFSFADQLDSSSNKLPGNNSKTNEPWSSMLDEDEPFSSYDNDIPSSSWTMNDINIFSQPPSLLFSEATLSSALEDDINSVPLIEDLSSDLQQPLVAAATTEATPLNESTPNCTTPSRCEVTTPSVVSTNTPVHTADGLWFQFANFDDDYHCET